jgi:CubicO group peptidase (beta-lactamase class C family)
MDQLSPDLTVKAYCAEFPGAYSLAFGRLSDFGIEVVESVNDHFVAPFASVSKLVTALAAEVAHEEGSIDLWLTQPSGGVSIADLLGHASGLREDGSVSQLDDAFLVAPRTRRIYSNLGFELTAHLISRGADMEFVEYVEEGVLGPLGMTARYQPNLFVPGGRGGATGLVGTVQDLVALVRGLWATRVVSRGALDRIRTPYLPELPGVLPGFGAMALNSWGMGAEIRGVKSPHWTGTSNAPETFGHFGRAGSFLWIDPVAQVFAVSLSEVPFGGWSTRLWPKLSEAILREMSEL